jgi:hypothetical protein
MKPVHVPPFLTQDEVDNLPENTRVVVTWFGGNRPYEYIIRRPFSVATAALDRNSYYINLGTSKPHTLVTIQQEQDPPARRVNHA